MGRHVAFWIGVFCAGIVIMPIALGVWAMARGFAQDVAVALFAAIAFLVLLLVFVLVFRDAILRRLVGRSEATLEAVSNSLIAGVSAAARGDIEAAEREAQILSRQAMGWYAWSSFYRWVIATALGLLLAFASFTGTVLLYEQLDKLERQTAVMDDQRRVMEAQTAFMEAQTRRLEEQTQQAQIQNEILTLDLVDRMRNQMLASIEDVSPLDVLNDYGVRDSGGPLARSTSRSLSCGIGLNASHVLQTPPSRGTLGAIVELTSNDVISARVIEALKHLLLDRNGGVAFGALLALDAAGHADPETAYTFREVAFSNIIHTNGVVFQNPVYTIEFQSSAIMNFFCKECAISSYGSLLWRLRAPLVAGHSNVIVSPAPEMVLEGISVASAGWDLPAGWVSEPLEIGPMFRSDMRAELTLREQHEPCQRFDALSFATPVLERR